MMELSLRVQRAHWQCVHGGRQHCVLEDSVVAWVEATGSEGWMGGEEEGMGSVQVRSSLKTDQGLERTECSGESD